MLEPTVELATRTRIPLDLLITALAVMPFPKAQRNERLRAIGLNSDQVGRIGTEWKMTTQSKKGPPRLIRQSR